MSITSYYESIYGSLFWIAEKAPVLSPSLRPDLKIKALFKKFLRDLEASRQILNQLRGRHQLSNIHLFSSSSYLYFHFLNEALLVFSRSYPDKQEEKQLHTLYFQLRMSYADVRLDISQQPEKVEKFKMLHQQFTDELKAALPKENIPWNLLFSFFSLMQKDHIADIRLLSLFHSQFLPLDKIERTISIANKGSSEPHAESIFPANIPLKFVSSFLNWYHDLILNELDEFHFLCDFLSSRSKELDLGKLKKDEKLQPIFQMAERHLQGLTDSMNTISQQWSTVIDALSKGDLEKVLVSLDRILAARDLLKKETIPLLHLDIEQKKEALRVSKEISAIVSQFSDYLDIFIEEPALNLHRMVRPLLSIDEVSKQIFPLSEKVFQPITDAFIGLPPVAAELTSLVEESTPRKKTGKKIQKGKKKQAPKKKKAISKPQKIVLKEKIEIPPSPITHFNESVALIKNYGERIYRQFFNPDLPHEARIHLRQAYSHLRWIDCLADNMTAEKTNTLFLNYFSLLSHTGWAIEQILHARHWILHQSPPPKAIQHHLVQLALSVNIQCTPIIEELKLINHLERYGLENQYKFQYALTFFPEKNYHSSKTLALIHILAQENIDPSEIRDQIEDVYKNTAELLDTQIIPTFPSTESSPSLRLPDMPSEPLKFDNNLYQFNEEIFQADLTSIHPRIHWKMKQMRALYSLFITALQEAEEAKTFKSYALYTYRSLRLSQNVLATALQILIFLESGHWEVASDISHLTQKTKDLNLHVGHLFHGVGQKSRYPFQSKSSSLGSGLIDQLESLFLAFENEEDRLVHRQEIRLHNWHENSVKDYHKTLNFYLKDLHSLLKRTLEKIKISEPVMNIFSLSDP